MPPSPPAQVDWVILQRFASDRGRAALAELRASGCNASQGAAPMLLGRDDVHLVSDGGAGVLPAPVSAVISTRIKPGQEAAYRAWEQRIAAAQSKAPGFQGYRFEPPVPGVQEDWLAILRFDTEANLQAWLDSPERQELLEEAAPLHRGIPRPHRAHRLRSMVPDPRPGAPAPAGLEAEHARPADALSGGLPVWRSACRRRCLMRRLGPAVRDRAVHRQRRERPLLNYLVPWTSNRFSWWLQPAARTGGSSSPGTRWWSRSTADHAGRSGACSEAPALPTPC